MNLVKFYENRDTPSTYSDVSVQGTKYSYECHWFTEYDCRIPKEEFGYTDCTMLDEITHDIDDISPEYLFLNSEQFELPEKNQILFASKCGENLLLIVLWSSVQTTKHDGMYYVMINLKPMTDEEVEVDNHQSFLTNYFEVQGDKFSKGRFSSKGISLGLEILSVLHEHGHALSIEECTDAYIDNATGHIIVENDGDVNSIVIIKAV